MGPGAVVERGGLALILVYREKEWHLQGPLTLREAIERVGLDPRLVVAVRRGEILSWLETAHDGDRVELVDLVDGG